MAKPLTDSVCSIFFSILSGVLTDQCTEQIHSLLHQLLVSDPRHAQSEKILVAHPEELLTVYLLTLEGRDVLLQAVIQT